LRAQEVVGLVRYPLPLALEKTQPLAEGGDAGASGAECRDAAGQLVDAPREEDVAARRRAAPQRVEDGEELGPARARVGGAEGRQRLSRGRALPDGGDRVASGLRVVRRIGRGGGAEAGEPR